MRRETAVHPDVIALVDEIASLIEHTDGVTGLHADMEEVRLYERLKRVHGWEWLKENGFLDVYERLYSEIYE